MSTRYKKTINFVADSIGVIGGGDSGLEAGSGSSSTIMGLSFNGDHIFVNSQTTNMSFDTTRDFRDTNGWMHLVMSGNNGTGIIYVNGTNMIHLALMVEQIHLGIMDIWL